MRPIIRLLLAVVVFAAFVLVSSSVGIPHDAKGREALPTVALDWRLLFHVLRAGALLGTLATVGLVAWRGAHGEWPMKFANVEYAPKEAVAVTGQALAKQDRRLRLIEAHVGLDDTRIEEDPT